MQIVIDVPDETYEYILNGSETSIDEGNVVMAVRNGRPLQKGHGRLIDADEFVLLHDSCRKGNVLKGDDDAFLNVIRQVTTVIEADKEDV